MLPGAEGSSAPVLLDLQDRSLDDAEAFFTRFNSSSNLLLSWNRGVATHIFHKGGTWAAHLHQLGFRLPYAFGCVFRFLFRCVADWK